MRPLHFLDPFGSRLPALERNMLRLRSMQMVLVLFYAEQLKQKLVGLVRTTDKIRKTLELGTSERVPRNVKDQIKKCLNAFVADSAITTDERDEMRRLIDYRNVIAHGINELVGDLSADREVRGLLNSTTWRFRSYGYKAVDRLRHFLKLLSDPVITRRYISSISLDSLKFASVERTLLADIKELQRKIDRQMVIRDREVRELNAQIKPAWAAELSDHPRNALNQYDNKRLTLRGQEVCYRLFDQGMSSIAVAHLMDISLAAARKRRRMWERAGGSTRPAVDLDDLPRREFYAND